MNNWNLLCPHLRGIYNNVEAFGSFMESFIVCNAKKKHRPAWYGKFSLLVQLIAKMMDTCTPATYNAMKWKTNPAEFIHVIRTHEVAPAPNPGEAGADNLRHLLYGTVLDTDSPPAPEPVTPKQGVQNHWNRKGLVADDGRKKLAFGVLRDHYRERKQEAARRRNSRAG